MREPSMEVMGVRSSWLTMEINSSLMRFYFKPGADVLNVANGIEGQAIGIVDAGGFSQTGMMVPSLAMYRFFHLKGLRFAPVHLLETAQVVLHILRVGNVF